MRAKKLFRCRAPTEQAKGGGRATCPRRVRTMKERLVRTVAWASLSFRTRASSGERASERATERREKSDFLPAGHLTRTLARSLHWQSSYPPQCLPPKRLEASGGAERRALERGLPSPHAWACVLPILSACRAAWLPAVPPAPARVASLAAASHQPPPSWPTKRPSRRPKRRLPPARRTRRASTPTAAFRCTRGCAAAS